LQLRQNILTGATRGLLTWLVYGIVEFVLACGIPLLFVPGVELLGWQLRPIALLFGLYALFGTVLGVISGVLLTWTDRHSGSSKSHETAAALTLVLAFVANLIPAWPLSPSEYFALAIAVMLAASFAGALASSVWEEFTGFLANPWALSLLLLSVPWVNRIALVDHSTTLRVGVSLLLLGVILLLAALWYRLRSGRYEIVRRQAVLAGTASLLLLSAALFGGRTSIARADQNSGVQGSGKPNVVLITMDTVRADHLSLYGYERDTTPYLRDLVREATVYTRAAATSDQTLTTHASILTGLYPSWHGSYVAPPNYPYGRPLAARHITLAEVLRANGYWTAAEVANYGMLAPWMGMAKGFAEYHSPRAIRLSQLPWEFAQPFYLRERAWHLLSPVVDTAAFETHCLRGADINRHAFALLDRARNGDQPFFLFLNYMDAHGPYVVPPPFNTRFPGRDPHFKRLPDHMWLTFGVNGGQRQISTAERRHLVSQYDGGIAYEDEQIGSLIARLRELGLYENTLIVITGDHGEALGEHDLMQHAVGSVYQDLVHVPLLIKYPKQHEARQSDALASQVDLMPTVLDLVGVALPTGVQGRTLRLPRTGESDAVYSDAIAPLSLFQNPRFRGIRRGIFAGSWKLITWTQGPPELYDLAADPEETRNLYRSGDSRANQLADRLSAWAATAPHQIEQPHKLDNNTVERLKSLGYAQ
jgi:arylsulfatase A-like enzyme